MRPGILNRYLAVWYARTAAATLAAIIAVVLVIDFADRAYSFKGEGWFGKMVRLYANLSVDLAYQTIPAALLVAAGVTVSAFRAQGELTAFQALGNRPGRLIAVVLSTVAAAALGVVALHEWAVVDAARKADEIKITEFRRPAQFQDAFAQQRWFRSGDWIYNLRERREEGFVNVSLYQLSEDFELRRRIDAAEMQAAADGSWLLRDAVVSVFEDGARLEVSTNESLSLHLPERQEDFQIHMGMPRHLHLGELLRQIDSRRKLGLPDVEFRQEIYRRLMFPLSAVPASLISIRLALRRRRRGHLGAAMGEGILISLLLWTLFTIFRAFGAGGAVSPAVSGLAPSAIMLAIGVGLGLSQDSAFRRLKLSRPAPE